MDKTGEPTINADNRIAEGRDGHGRFAKGNKGGPGNPHIKQIAAFRMAVLNAVTTEDMVAIIKTLVTQAIDGDVASAKLVLDRIFGNEVIAKIEATVDTQTHGIVLVLPANGTETDRP